MLEILYEDNHIIIVNKPNNVLVQPDNSGDKSLEEMVKLFLKEKYNKPGDAFLGVVHRIDRPVSGVVVFAKTSKALTRLNKMFQDKNVKKIYWAIVKNKPAQEKGTLQHYIVRNNKQNKSYAYEKPTADGKLSVLHYSIIGNTDNYFLLNIILETGRHHQIRCQLAKIGCPIKGDLKYGFSRSNKDGGISLHSRSVEFKHPVSGEIVKVKAPCPNDVLWKEFEKLNNKK